MPLYDGISEAYRMVFVIHMAFAMFLTNPLATFGAALLTFPAPPARGP
jgi:hypothetical protein